MTHDTATRRILGLEWPAEMTVAERRSLVAGGLGWMLDAMDVMLYSMVLADLVVHLGMSKPQAGLLNSLTLFASAIGGLTFGIAAAVMFALGPALRQSRDEGFGDLKHDVLLNTFQPFCGLVDFQSKRAFLRGNNRL